MHLYNRALIYQKLGRATEAVADLAYAIRLTQQRLEETPKNVSNTFNLALYYLASGQSEKAEQFYNEGLAHEVSSHYVRSALQDLREFSYIFPDQPYAQVKCEQLQMAMAVGSEMAVNELTTRLQMDGYVVLDGPRRTGDGYYESVVLDPDGNRIEITV